MYYHYILQKSVVEHLDNAFYPPKLGNLELSNLTLKAATYKGIDKSARYRPFIGNVT
jgi:hypothetical protein